MNSAERLNLDAATADPPAWMNAILRQLAGGSAHSDWKVRPLSGGVSSDIFRVDSPAKTVCVKRALPKLRVLADWRAPVERNRYEVAWLRVAGEIVPGSVPAILADDPAEGAFAMEWLAPERFPVWKSRLADGAIELHDARRVGDVLGRLHAATADRADLARRFATDDLFRALRLEPYLLATGIAHPDVAGQLQALVETTAATRRVLIHGDFSPKNLLIGPTGPLVLDAECAWYGDPAFDLAFVLNHLLLKGCWRTAFREQYSQLFDALVSAYSRHVEWEAWAELDARTARLLPGLMLARIDGKSPVEYLTRNEDRDEVRGFARERLFRPRSSLGVILAEWGRSSI